MSVQVGVRVRSTMGFGPMYPEGITGVVTALDGHGGVEVQLDRGDSTWFHEDSLEEYTPVFASHYQAQPIMDEPAPATDDAGPTPDTPLSGEELMNITRSFCR